MAVIEPEDLRKWEAPLPTTLPQASAFKAGIRKLAARFLYLVDSGIPGEMLNGDPDVARRARIIVSFTLVLILLGVESGVFFARFLEPVAALQVEISLVLAMSLTALIPVIRMA